MTGQEQLLSELTTLVSHINNGITVASAQLPSAIHDMMMWKLLVLGTWTVIPLVVSMWFYFYPRYWFNKNFDKLPKHDQDKFDQTDRKWVVPVSYLIGSFFIAITIANIYDIIKITVFTNYWLMETSIQLIEQIHK